MKFTAEFNFKSFTLSVIFLAVTSLCFASFEPLPVGGRAAGMGEAYSAVVDDVYAVYYNPAGVMQLERPEVGSYYSKLFSGLTDGSQISRTFIAYGQPLHKGRKANGSIAVSYLSLDLSGLYKEETMGVTYGREFDHRWNLGGTLKILRKKVGSDEFSSNAINPETGNSTSNPDPVLASGKSANALALDLGFQYRLARAYALGISARNINKPDVALSDLKDNAPAIYNLALARRLRNGSLDVELMNWNSTGNNTRFSIGGECWFANGFGLRAGGGFGTRNYSAISFGASYKMESIQFDYASILPLQGIQGTLGTQQISLTVRLGKPPTDPIEAQLIKEKEERIKAEAEARLATAERDRLKKELFELTTAKSKEKQIEEQSAAQKALEEARQQAAQQAKPRVNETDETPDSKIFSEYTAALAEYNSKVQQGIGLVEKRQLLEKIQNKFANTKINLSTIKRELKGLQLDETRAKKEFDLSLNFYQRLVQQGANTDERRGMLERIIQKYKDSGVDINAAESELKKLK